MTTLEFDDFRTASLDGHWDFFPGDHRLEELDRLTPAEVAVPGLWEAQGYVDLDGSAWYRRRFALEEADGGWTLRFGAVMDFADVYVNGIWLGHHEQAFTPFEVDPAPALHRGENDLAVRVVDPALADPDHRRMAHGKQGWANHVFPSRPSLYMTYGGIWQPVTLRRHGLVVVYDVFVEANPDDLVVRATIENRGPRVRGEVGVRTLGMAQARQVDLGAGEKTRLEVSFGPTRAARWRPEDPALHGLYVDVRVGSQLCDSRVVRYGLRTVRLDGTRMLIDDEPYRMKSVLVQGFTAEGLYAEGDDSQIRAEVQAARDMGFNTLRLHIKAFDPRYLDVCDEMGMLLHCDIPVAEPIVHEEMGGDSPLVQRSVAAAREQVRRDRNHPSIVLWSAMNEICEGRSEARDWPQYESFARSLFRAVHEEDPTRPVIENDWVEPDPERVFESPILTAHWYGRLHRDYLDQIDDAAQLWTAAGRPLFVTEFGDWGLPDMAVLAEPPFWDTRSAFAAALADTLWPATVGRFARETQRYQGLSDRLQAEVFRRHDGIGGYCLTELTDVPIELNGLLDLRRQPKPLAVTEVVRANQPVLPMLSLESFVATAGQAVRARLHVANDGPALGEVSVETRFGDSTGAVAIDEVLAVGAADIPVEQIEGRFGEKVSESFLGDVPAHTSAPYGEVTVVAPDVAGNHDLVLRLRAGGVDVSENRYPIHVVETRPAAFAVRVLGGGDGESTLRAVGAVVGDVGPAVVEEGGLDAETGRQARRLLDDGGVVLILAQEPAAAAWFPVPTALEELATVWGSTVFTFTTDHGAVPSLPRRNLVACEDSTIHARHVVAGIDGVHFPDTPVVIAYKPVPNAVTGTVVGSHAVGGGRLVFCQYRLAHRVEEGDPAACAILGDLVRWIARPRPVLNRRTSATADGRQLVAFDWRQDVGR